MAIRKADAIALPSVEIDSVAVEASITGEQAGLVANRAARDICAGFSPFIRIGDVDGAARVRITVRAIKANSSTAAVVSEAIGLFVPGPFRIPVGLGGFAADGVLEIGERPVVVLQRSKVANPITEGARISPIGDAYQLAGALAVESELAHRGDDPPLHGLEAVANAFDRLGLGPCRSNGCSV